MIPCLADVVSEASYGSSMPRSGPSNSERSQQYYLADDGSRSNDNNNGYTHITNNDFIGGVSPTPFKLKNVHVGLKKPGDDGTKLYLVHGEYIYYHYMQDRYDDKGWGCAYRSLQTLVSWFRFNNSRNW